MIVRDIKIKNKNTFKNYINYCKLLEFYFAQPHVYQVFIKNRVFFSVFLLPPQILLPHRPITTAFIVIIVTPCIWSISAFSLLLFVRRLSAFASRNAVATCEIKLFKIISAFVDVYLNLFYFSAWKLDLNYFEIISEDYCSSWIFYNMFNVAEIISKWFQNFFSGLNNCISVSDVVISLHVGPTIKRWNNFKIISN